MAISRRHVKRFLVHHVLPTLALVTACVFLGIVVGTR